jgi:hypothetical protein
VGLSVPPLARLASVLAIVNPETVVAWHRAGFRLLDLEGAARPTGATLSFRASSGI